MEKRRIRGTKAMYDGTIVTETKYRTVFGYFDDSAAYDMFLAIQDMQSQQGWAPGYWGNQFTYGESWRSYFETYYSSSN